MLHDIAARFRRLAPALDFYSLRLVESRSERLSMRQDLLEPIDQFQSLGAHLTVIDGGIGYAAGSDLSDQGLRNLIERARRWARLSAEHGILTPRHQPRPQGRGRYQSRVVAAWDEHALEHKLDLLTGLSRALKTHSAIVDWRAELACEQSAVLLVTPEAEIQQAFCYLEPSLEVVASRGLDTQKRSYGCDYIAQSGMEHLERLDLSAKAAELSEQAVRLLDARPCPGGRRDLLLLPNQMLLQIHESIGHPLELDRILGDERNYAGTSFVTLDMFGHYRYGSELLNVCFDPAEAGQIASYGFDDDGTPAQREYLIRDGILLRPLGGLNSQNRAGCAGVAASRSCDWNRPAIDRMGNINLEPGATPLTEMIARVENGILMDTNRSWSIDDSRNKFQFGCEIAYLIEDGVLTDMVKSPNYRGISAEFWRSLKAVGDRTSFEVMGTAMCGKGEPNQAIRVGHAAPACLFESVDVFGDAE